MNLPRSLYVHVPFCRRRCGYCNFALVAGRDHLIEPFADALIQEMQQVLPADRPPVDTLYFGGGTPTHLPPDQLRRLMNSVLERIRLAAGAEVTLEANPLDVGDPARNKVLGELGANRVSLGVQSLRADKLQILDRDHQPPDVYRALDSLRQYGFSVAIDLIFGLADERPRDWDAELDQAISLAPDHISTYNLTVERGTAFWSRQAKGAAVATDADRSAAMYEVAIDRLTAAGYEHYEVSNFARPGFRSRHNQVYWSGQPYWALGPSAASFVENVRRTNHASVTTYIRRWQQGQSPLAEEESLTAELAARELLIFGLRRLEGIDAHQFELQTGFNLEQLGGKSLGELTRLGLLQRSATQLKLTRRGLLVSDSIWPQLL